MKILLVFMLGMLSFIMLPSVSMQNAVYGGQSESVKEVEKLNVTFATFVDVERTIVTDIKDNLILKYCGYEQLINSENLNIKQNILFDKYPKRPRPSLSGFNYQKHCRKQHRAKFFDRLFDRNHCNHYHQHGW
jgi:hypothetical protein